MSNTYDPEARAGYIVFSQEKISKTVPVSDSIVCDIDDRGMLVGIEVLSVTPAVFHALEKRMKFSIPA